jgi:hypothetical protein
VKNKIVLLQLWLGEIPDYFWFHYETTKNLNIDFLIFTDSELVIDSPNYKVIPITKDEVERKVSLMLDYEYKFKNLRKTNDLKSCLGELFEEHLTGYDFFGFYDIDTLFGDFQKLVMPYTEEYDVISFSDSVHHNRISGPFTIIRNTYENARLYRKNIDRFLEMLNLDNVSAFEEHELSKILIENLNVKLIYDSINCETHNGGKNTYDAYWSGGKVYVKNEEKSLYHFYRKNKTKLSKVGNLITATYDKVIVDDFYWVVSFTKSYETLFINLLESIKKYSNRKCIIYSINYDYFLSKYDLSNEQFIVRRIDIPEGDKDVRGRDNNIISSKPSINVDLINTFPDKKFVCIDSDIYFTVNSDNIKRYFNELENYPLINSHIHDVFYLSNIIEGEEWTSSLHILKNEMGVTTEIFPRRKTNVMIFDSNSEWFFKEQMEIYQKYKGTKPGILLFHDEDTANAVLAKYNLTKGLPLLDIEEVTDIDMGIFENYSYSMTDISQSVVLPKNHNEVLFFHGIKSQEHYDNIRKNYNASVIDCEEFVITYSNQTLVFEKNSFMTTKKVGEVVDFVIGDLDGNEIFRLGNQSFYNYWYFYVTNLFLEPNKYSIKIYETNTNKCIFNDILEVKK